MLKTFLLIATLLCTASARAEPVPQAERTPVDIRRTTFVVRDIDKSLSLYRWSTPTPPAA